MDTPQKKKSKVSEYKTSPQIKHINLKKLTMQKLLNCLVVLIFPLIFPQTGEI